MKAAAQLSAANPSPLLFIVGVGLLGLMAAIFYGPVAGSLVREWYEHENFTYGFLIPVVAGYLIFEQRGVLKQSRAVPDLWGVAWLTGALLLGLLGNALGEPFVARLALVLTIIALVYATAGRAIVAQLAFPLAYLFFMVPPPYMIVKQVSYYLRMFDATVATLGLQLIGIPIYRDAYFLYLPHDTLEVADVCSGIASLFAMVALGTIYANFLPIRRGAKISVLLGAMVFPLLANLLRIFLVAVSVYNYGPVMLGAFYHNFTGTFTFSLSLVMLMIWGEAMRRRYPALAPASHAATSTSGDLGADSRPGRDLTPIAMAGLALGLALFLSQSMAGSKIVRLPGPLDGLPKQLGAYQEATATWSDRYQDPQADTTISRLYQTQNQPVIELFIGHRGAQYAEQRLRSPKLTFPDGWEYAAVEQIAIAAGGASVDAGWLLTKKGNAKRVVLFWYRVDDQTFAGDFRHRLELARRLLIKGRTDGSVIRLATDVTDSETNDRAVERLKNFIEVLQPELSKLLPAQ